MVDCVCDAQIVCPDLEFSIDVEISLEARKSQSVFGNW